jgi:hypothetical protein
VRGRKEEGRGWGRRKKERRGGERERERERDDSSEWMRKTFEGRVTAV